MRGNRTIRFFVSYVKNLPQINEKEKKILISRAESKTLERIGENLNVTEGRIRQIEKMALKKIKDRLYQLRLFKQ